jgi:hypothetical protein
MKRIHACIVVGVLVCGWLGGCSSTDEIVRRSELQAMDSTRTIHVLLRDGALLAFRRWHAGDSTIKGRAEVWHGSDVQGDVDTTVVFSDITHIAARSVGAEVIIAGIVVGITAVTVLNNVTSGGSSYTVYEKKPWSGDGSSCPHLYAWDGRAHVLEGEAFGAALGRRLEMTTVTAMPHLVAIDGRVHVRITNERPETDYINAVALLAVETDIDADVAVDTDNRLRPLGAIAAPDAARDHAGTDILARIGAADTTSWSSDLAGARRGGTYQDTLVLRFARPRDAREACLVVRGRNTDLSGTMLELIYGLLGDEAIRFIHAHDVDSTTGALLAQWRDRSALHVAVRRGGAWLPAGSIMPEATAIDMTRLAPLADLAGDTVEVMLTTLADMWRIDRVGMSWGAAPPLVARRIAPAEAAARTDLAARDESYRVLMPGEAIDCTFDAIAAAPGRRIWYALEATGYLHEWMRPDAGASARTLARTLPVKPDLHFVHEIFRHPELTLPAIYAEWRTVRARLRMQ